MRMTTHSPDNDVDLDRLRLEHIVHIFLSGIHRFYRDAHTSYEGFLVLPTSEEVFIKRA